MTPTERPCGQCAYFSFPEGLKLAEFGFGKCALLPAWRYRSESAACALLPSRFQPSLTGTLGTASGVRRPVSKDIPDRTDALARTCPASGMRPKRTNRTNRTTGLVTRPA
jgi:hypothetical protein